MNMNTAFPSKYLKADGDIPEDGNLIVTMTTVEMEDIGTADQSEEKPVLYFREVDKGMVLNKTNSQTISGLYGPETDNWKGRKIALFSTEVDFAGKQVLAIRVRMKKPKDDAPAAAPVAKPNPALLDDNDPFADE